MNYKTTTTTIIVFLICSYALAEVPDWINKTVTVTSTDYLIVGRGSSDNLQVAQDQARKDAVQTAIKEIYGFKTQISTVSYETTTNSEIVNAVADKSQSIQLNDFNELDFYTAQTNDTVNVYVRYKYSKAAIKDEFQRLSTVKDKDQTVELISIEALKNKAQYKIENNNAKLSEVRYSNYYKIINPVSLSVGSSALSKPFEDGKSLIGLHLDLEKRISFVAVGLEFDQYSESSKDDGSKEKIKANNAGINLKYYFNPNSLENYYISASAGQMTAKLTHSDIKQNYYGLSVGWFPYVFYGELGAKKFTDDDSIKGLTAIFVSGGLKISF